MEVSLNVLTYKGSFLEPTTEYLTLTNTTSAPLAFKVKTTAPKLYCVRPNASIIAPNESVKISIILQGFTQPLPKDYKCRDKFLIVSCPCPTLNDPSKVAENWSALQEKYGDEGSQKKLRVNFVIDNDSRDETHANETTFANATQNSPVREASTVNSDGDNTVANDRTINNATDSTVLADETPSVSKQQQRDLAESANKINNLSEKLDSNEAAATTEPASEDTVSGVSIPFAVVLVLIALLLGWYIF